MASTRKTPRKYIFVIGGVMSGVGKGVVTASFSNLLQARGFRVNPIKVDPYLNVDAGTMNPTEHGEVFVLASGLETDQDMGTYERFTSTEIPGDNYMTSGMVYNHVLTKERNLAYKGKCVEAIPHVTDEIARRIKGSARKADADITIVEIGGTVGEYQNVLFMEAARVMKLKNPDDVLFTLVTYLPAPKTIGEMKTKPTQNAVRQLNALGIQTQMIIARSEQAMDKKRREKLAIWCNVAPESVIAAPDVTSIYDVPLNFEREGSTNQVLELLNLPGKRVKPKLAKWKQFVRNTQATDEIKIAVVGKYFKTGDFVLSDVYLSVIEALKFSAAHLKKKPVLEWISSQDIESGKVQLKEFNAYDGILVPGGFGETGIEGKIKVIEYARKKKIPYFGLCYGMQLLVIEYARNVLKLKDAHTTEINPETKDPLVYIMPSQRKNLENDNYGGSMRLGSYPAEIKKGSVARSAYRQEAVVERHRHRYEVNPEYVERLEKKGLVFSGTSPDGRLMEIAELPKKEHPFFLGTQFHPEFLAHPLKPHPLFTAFLKAASN